MIPFQIQENRDSNHSGENQKNYPDVIPPSDYPNEEEDEEDDDADFEMAEIIDTSDEDNNTNNNTNVNFSLLKPTR